MCGDRKFSSHDWVNELDTIGDHIADIAEIESHAPGSEAWSSLWVALLVDAADSEHALVSRIVSYKNLGDGDKQVEDDDDETVIDLKEYTCVEKILRQWDDNADSPMSERRRVETSSVSCFHCTNRRCCCRSLTYCLPTIRSNLCAGRLLLFFFDRLLRHSAFTRRERESMSTEHADSL